MPYKLKLPAQVDYLRQFLQFIVGCAQETGYSQERATEIELAVEEALVNICHYAYPGTCGEVEIRCQEGDGRKLIIEIQDEGIPFDVCMLPEPDVSCDLRSRKVGGLGVFIIRKLINEVYYRREGDHNVLVLIVYPERCPTPGQTGRHLQAA